MTLGDLAGPQFQKAQNALGQDGDLIYVFSVQCNTPSQNVRVGTAAWFRSFALWKRSE